MKEIQVHIGRRNPSVKANLTGFLLGGGDGVDLTAENIKTALGYTPADQEDVDKLSEEIVDCVKTVNGKTAENGEVTVHADDINFTLTEPISGEQTEENLGEYFNDFSIALSGMFDPDYAEALREIGYELVMAAPVVGDVTNATIKNGNSTIGLYEYIQQIVQIFTGFYTETTSELAKKVGFSNVIDDLTTASSSSPLSANQGKVLKGLIDKIKVPTKTSELTNDSGFITTEEVPDVDLSLYSTTAQMKAYVQEQLGAIENGNGVAY